MFARFSFHTHGVGFHFNKRHIDESCWRSPWLYPLDLDEVQVDAQSPALTTTTTAATTTTTTETFYQQQEEIGGISLCRFMYLCVEFLKCCFLHGTPKILSYPFFPVYQLNYRRGGNNESYP